MRSFIIASKNPEKVLEEALKICTLQKIDKIDITIEDFEKIAGIEGIKNTLKNLFLKPIRGDYKALILNASYGFTTEAQNTLLKALEEPPLSSFIFLIVEEINALLPTI